MHEHAPGAADDTAVPQSDQVEEPAQVGLALADRLLQEDIKSRLFGRPAQPIRMGRFVVLKKVGAGGLGEVYAAYDEKLDRKVAIKLVHAGHEIDARERLLREARVLARLSHPNVVPVYEVGEFGAQIFLVMELVSGRTLTTWLADTSEQDDAARWREVLDVFLSAGRGLQAAHQTGLVHRDVKPDNIIVGDDGRVRVLDFGLARATGSPPAHADARTEARTDVTADPRTDAGEPGPGERLTSTRASADTHRAIPALTATGAIAGTPAYMAPEQWRGQACDARTDQFSFCVALYEALYGARPFGGDDLASVRRAVLDEQPAPVPESAQAPDAVYRVLARGLEKRPEDRFQDLQALIDALEDILSRRSPWPRVLTIVVFALLLALVLWVQRGASSVGPCAQADASARALWNAERATDVMRSLLAAGRGGVHVQASLAEADRRIDRYVADIAQARMSVCRATHVERSQSEQLFHDKSVCLDRRTRELGAFVSALEERPAAVLSSAHDTLAELPPVATCLSSEVALSNHGSADVDPSVMRDAEDAARAIAVAQAHHRDGDRSASLAEARAQLPRVAVLGTAPLHAEALYRIGDMMMRDESFQDAEDTLVQAESMARSNGYDDLLMDIELSLSQLARRGHDDTRVGHVWARQAWDIGQRLGERGDRSARALRLRGELYRRDGDLDQALALQRQALEDSQASGRDPIEIASNWHALANTLAALPERREEARQAFAQAWAIQREELGAGHPWNARLLHDMARFLASIGELERAYEYITAALDIWSGIYQCQPESGAPDPDCRQVVSGVFYQRARIEQKLGHLAEAGASARASRAILERLRDSRPAEAPGHPDQLRIQIARLDRFAAVQSFYLGEYDDALVDYQRALAVYQEELEPSHELIARSHIWLAEALVELARHEDALARLERVVDLEQTLADRPVSRAIFHQSRGLALLGLGAHAAAIAPLERARAILEDTGEAPEELADVLFGLARALRHTGRATIDETRALAERARSLYQGQTPHAAARRRAIDAWTRNDRKDESMPEARP